MNTKVQNFRCKLDKCLCLSCVWVLACMCKVCSRVSESFLLTLQTLSLANNSFSDTKAFLLLPVHSQAPQQQYIVHFMHYSITLWAYLSEPLIKTVTNVYVRWKNHNTAWSSHITVTYMLRKNIRKHIWKHCT